MNQSDKQRIFNEVYQAIVDQGGPSYDYSENVCKYRHEGRKCVFGHLIPDPLYTESLEGESVMSIADFTPLL